MKYSKHDQDGESRRRLWGLYSWFMNGRQRAKVHFVLDFPMTTGGIKREVRARFKECTITQRSVIRIIYQLIDEGLVRELRLESGLSQAKLADIAGCDRTYVSMLERKLGNPSLAMIAAGRSVARGPTSVA